MPRSGGTRVIRTGKAAIAEFFARFVVQVLGSAVFLLGMLSLLFLEDWHIGAVMTIAVAGAVGNASPHASTASALRYPMEPYRSSSAMCRPRASRCQFW